MSSTAPAIPEVTVSTCIHVRDIATQFDLYTQTPNGAVVLQFGGWGDIFLRNEDELALLALKITEYLEAHTAKDAEQAA